MTTPAVEINNNEQQEITNTNSGDDSSVGETKDDNGGGKNDDDHTESTTAAPMEATNQDTETSQQEQQTNNGSSENATTSPPSTAATTTTTINSPSSSALSPSTTATAIAPAAAPTTTISETLSPNAPIGLGIASSMPAIGKRLSVQIETLENRINNDMYDTDAWTLLLNEVQSQPINIARNIYERFLNVFPTAGRYWKLYIEQEMAGKNYDMVEKIFLKSLRSVKNVELWKLYITYIKTIKSDNNREEIIKAFELALENIGMDISSTPIWTEYIAYLKEEKTNTTFEEGQKMTSIRKLYQRAVENPMHELDAIWKEYDQFENSINKVLAKSLLTEHYNKYQQARNVYRDRKALLEGILRNMLAKPPRTSDKEEHQVRLWRKLIAYERTNPQRFDQASFRNRVTATYNQCLLCLYRYPDIWYEAATYQAECNNIDSCIQFYDRALVALPKNLFIHFAYADYLESIKKLPQAKEIYEKLITSTSTTTTTSTPSSTTTATPTGTTTTTTPTPTATTTTTSNFEPLAWIQYMKFARRTERVDGPRKIFKRAKAQPDCTFHPYIALGLIEFYVNQDPKMARDLFELGLKKFPNDTCFIHFYIEFLTSLNEENNTRVLFEKLLSQPNFEKSEFIWRKYLDFEYRQNQDITAINKLEKRFQNTMSTFDKTGVLHALNRYKFLDLWCCHPNEIAIITKNLLDDQDQLDSKTSDEKATAHNANSGHYDKKKKFGKKDKGHKDQHHKEGGADSGGITTNDKPTASTVIPSSKWRGIKRPDLTQMIPYRSEIGKFTPSQSFNIPRGNNDIIGQQQQQQEQSNVPNSGNRWDIPESLLYFLQTLPPPSQFNGPFIDPDQIMMLFRNNIIPNNNFIPNNGMKPQQQQFNNPIQNQNQQIPPQQQHTRSSPPIQPINIPPQQQQQQQQQFNPSQQQPQQIPPPQANLKRKTPDDNEIDINSIQQAPVQPTMQTPQPTAVTTTATPSSTTSISKPTPSDLYRKRQASKLSKKS
ncbi:hypothetical protein CYY_005997 [Polysphondylium violaceum]|uniref:Suppressor of forked domain-containing protein n=1 Tax=Polysphondylium violaceum TaxID=133409 RepID=A0A8J4URT1_9MYCE|nr:hypothetical protein CYY_005997 [Polysphondylium violaceum]